jgi:hypothetical protein
MDKTIGNQIITEDGYAYTVVDVTKAEYIVRAGVCGQDMSMSDGECGIDWEYVYIPFAEAKM